MAIDSPGGSSFETQTASAPQDEDSGSGVASPSPVIVELDVVADLAALSGFPGANSLPSGAVPVTFPIVWLAHPAIRAAIEGCAKPGEVAFHEDQAFEYRAALEAGASYGLFAEIDRQEEPARVSIASRVDSKGETVLTMRTLLRLVDGTLATQSIQAGAAQQ